MAARIARRNNRPPALKNVLNRQEPLRVLLRAALATRSYLFYQHAMTVLQQVQRNLDRVGRVLNRVEPEVLVE